MTTLYSAAITIKGVKKRGVSLSLDYNERFALKQLVTTIAAVQDLTPNGDDLRCGARASKAYCTKVADGLAGLLGLDEEEALYISGEHIKDLFKFQKQLNAILDGKTSRSKEIELSAKSVNQLIAAGKALTKYQDDKLGNINVGGNEISRGKLIEIVAFLKGVNRNVLIRG